MKKNLFVLMCSLLTIFPAGCSNEEDDLSNSWLSKVDKETASDPNSIIGTWELKTLCYPEGDWEIPSENRDLFMFYINGKMKVVIKKGKPLYPDLPNEDGEYNYSYDKEKQIIQLCGETLKCIISNGEMSIEGDHYGPDDGLYFHKFQFIKKSKY
jgi:hypothetical protein